MRITGGMLSVLLLLAIGWLGTVARSQEYTDRHEEGYCAMFGECGENLIGNLNCPYNGPAKDPYNSPDDFDDPDLFVNTLADYCGEKYRNSSVCCNMDQLNTLMASVAKSQAFLQSCLACFDNMKTMWCDLTCSPNQSLMANVTSIDQGKFMQEDMVDALSYYVTDEFGEQLYDSCAEVKYGQSNSMAMDLVGGGAENYKEFLEFMGKPNVMGTPFPIAFLWDDDVAAVMEPLNLTLHTCYDEGEYKCFCVDCTASCPPVTPAEEEREPCYVGSIGCLAFSLLIIYFTGLLCVVAIFSFVYFRYRTPDMAVSDTNKEKATINRELHEWLIYIWLQKFYFRMGTTVARHPLTVILVSSILVGVCCIGLVNFQVETDPVLLWAAEDSDTFIQKEYFDTTFAPFYRAAQVIISLKDTPDETIIPKDDKSYIGRLFDIEDGIQNIVADFTFFNGTQTKVTFQDICLKPLLPFADYCMIQSVTSYWQQDKDKFEKDPFENSTFPLPDLPIWYAHLVSCLQNPTFPGFPSPGESGVIGSCLPLFQDPIKPQVALGGFDDDNYLNATALVSSIIVENKVDEEYIQMATAWEREMVAYMKQVVEDNPDLRITFYTESSVEDELASESKSDLKTVTLSYLLMFLYVSIALGNFRSYKRFFIDTKFSLGIAGVFICLFSVLAAVGCFSAFGIKTSLIIAEVIPFLVLAIGVDNIFILVHSFDRLDKRLSVEERAALALGEVGPSVTLSAFSETIAFSLGAIVSMPAVYSFALFSATAIFIDFLLQVTAFVALLTLDARRTESKRIDCLPCIQLEDAPSLELSEQEGYLNSLFRKYYTPFIMHPVTKIAIIFSFVGMLFIFLAYIPYLELGLDQSTAVPSDSYLIDYFDDQATLLRVGAPVYFVVKGGNATTVEGQSQLCALNEHCDLYSVGNMIYLESLRPEYSFVALNPALWLDDFVGFLNPGLESCCREYPSNDTFCQPYMECENSTMCFTEEGYDNLTIAPIGTEFMHYLRGWLEAVPGESCGLAGRAGYLTAIAPDYEQTTILASHFRSYHTVLQTQRDYIDAYSAAVRICDDVMEQYPDLEVFPYSIFYVYFEQYLTIIQVAVFLILLALVAIFAVTWFILGSFLSALWVAIPTIMIVVDLIGVMSVWAISLNAVSLVNILMAVGISVEFCSHITRAYTVHHGSRDERARKALNDIGSSVFSGITLTKFIGVVVLAFAQSEIFIVYYFRMYLSIVLLGFGHGLMLLPVLLSFFGPTTSVKVTSPDGIDSHVVLVDEDDTYDFKASSAKLVRKEQEQRNAFYGSTSTPFQYGTETIPSVDEKEPLTTPTTKTSYSYD